MIAAGGLAAPGWAMAKESPLPLREAARAMALYGLPLLEMAATRQRALAAGQRVNTLRHARALLTPATQTVTQPNNDTLYSTAWLDLAQGPVRVRLPESGSRYFSLALMDMYTNNFAILGARTLGGDGAEVVLVGPDAPLPAPGAVRAPSNWVWALGRTMAGADADLPAAHALQDGLRVAGPAGRRPPAYAKRDAPWAEVFASLQALVLESPPAITDLRVFRRCTALGITPQGGFDADHFTAAQGAEIEAGLAAALDFAKRGGQAGERRGGWSFPRQDLGDFRQDYDYRAQVALAGLAALPLSEACYMRALAPDGCDTLDSRREWRLRFPKGQTPPVDAFWSLTCYEVTSAGQGFFFENPIKRYSLGDRTPGLAYRADGSLDIRISSRDPGAEHRANWLPAPTSGRPMVISLRAYLPRPELTTGRYVTPPVLPA
jgi:hypothetical protein